MVIKPAYVVRNVNGQYFVGTVGQDTSQFNVILHLNESGRMLFEALQKGATKDDLIALITERYEIDQVTAENDVDILIETLKTKDILVK